MAHPDRITAKYGRAPHPDDYGDMHNHRADTRSIWQTICEHREDVLIGAVIGLMFFPFMHIIFTALAVVVEALQ